MNKARRKEIERAIELLEDVEEILISVGDDEQYAYDNLPQGIQGSYRGEVIGENVDALDFAVNEIENIINELYEIIENK